MTQYNKKRAKDSLYKRNVEKADKVREKKLLGSSQKSRPHRDKNKTDTSFY